MVPGAPRCDIAVSWDAGRGEHAVLTTVDQVDRPIDHWVLQQRREQRLLEEKIIAASRELERMNRNLRDFASVAAHDLRAPLRQIVAFTGILRTTLGTEAGPVVSDSLDTIEGCAARLNRMTTGLLDYARLSAESHTFAPVDLGRVVEDATRNLDLDLRASSADLVVGPLPTVNGVPALLTNLFQNLVANSIRYRDPDRPLRIEIRAWPGEPGRITVRDTGIGVPPAFHEAIFETFARVPNGGRRTASDWASASAGGSPSCMAGASGWWRRRGRGRASGSIWGRDRPAGARYVGLFAGRATGRMVTNFAVLPSPSSSTCQTLRM